jgi:hypothetical protein
MRIPRHWATVEADLHINGQVQPSSFTGSSDLSEADARDAAWDQRALVQARIDANDGKRAEDYAVAIREEIVKELARDATVTRNRYGAEVLNCARLVMIDVDHAPPPGIWARLFRRETRSAKELMLDRILRVARAERDRSLGFRIYETHNGYRVLVTGRNLVPTEPTVQRLFDTMHCDPLYAMLCRRQDCYRARLTPKPSRIRHKAIRLRFPYDADTRTALAEWIPQYVDRSQRYTVCHLIEVIGNGHTDEVVRYHDDRCCRGRELPLA